MQTIVAVANLVSYYFIGLPVGVALVFAAKLRIVGNNSVHTTLCMPVQEWHNYINVFVLAMQQQACTYVLNCHSIICPGGISFHLLHMYLNVGKESD